MKFIKLFEEFKDSTANRANIILKQIEKVLRYNFQYGALAKKGYIFEHSEIYDDKGPFDWLKVELYSEEEKNEYLWNVIFMMDEEYLGEEAKEGEEKIYIEISKYRLPQYKKIVSAKKSYPLSEILEDEFLTKELEENNKNVLKIPTSEEDYKDNLKRQQELFKKEISIEDADNIIPETEGEAETPETPES